MDCALLRVDFPILDTQVHGRLLVYLDSAATMQMPLAVQRRMERFYRAENANIHRGIHSLSEGATTQYESVRSAVDRFLDAGGSGEIIFTAGTTASSVTRPTAGAVSPSRQRISTPMTFAAFSTSTGSRLGAATSAPCLICARWEKSTRCAFPSRPIIRWTESNIRCPAVVRYYSFFAEEPVMDMEGIENDILSDLAELGDAISRYTYLTGCAADSARWRGNGISSCLSAPIRDCA